MRRPWVSSDTYKAALAYLIGKRLEMKVTQRELAQRLGKSRSFVTRIEAKERRVDMVEFIAIARAIGVDPGAMMAELNQALPADLDF